nr:hypothetical protein [Tanacetum cinerariifolium]
MAISIISVSSDSSEESIGASTRRVIFLGTIPTTIPDTVLSMITPSTHVDTIPIPIAASTIVPSPDITPASPDYTPASPDYSLASDTETDPSEDPLPDHIPPLPTTSPFLSSTDNSSDSDIPNTPPSTTHGTPFTDTSLSTQRKRVGPLPTHLLVVRHSVDYSSLDQFSPNDSSRDSYPSSSSETSLDSSTDALYDSASSHSLSDHSLPTPSSDHLMILLLRAFLARGIDPLLRASYVRADHLPSTKRIRSSKIATDLEVSSEDRFEPYVPKGTNLEMDVDVVWSDEIEIDPEIQVEINEYIAYANALRDKGIDDRVVVEAVDRDEVRTDVRGAVEEHWELVTLPETLNPLWEMKEIELAEMELEGMEMEEMEMEEMEIEEMEIKEMEMVMETEEEMVVDPVSNRFLISLLKLLVILDKSITTMKKP